MGQFEFDFMQKTDRELKEISINCLENIRALLKNIVRVGEWDLQDEKALIMYSKWVADEDIK